MVMTNPAPKRDDIEELAEKLHKWYLEIVARLKPASYNPEAQKPYNELTSQQQEIDRYIASKVLAYFESLVPEKIPDPDKEYSQHYCWNNAIDQFHKNVRRSDG